MLKTENHIFFGNALEVLKEMSDYTIDCVVTSPPYYALRDYGNGNKEIGHETVLEKYIDNLVEIFNQVKRVLKPTGTCFIVINDTYAGTGVKQKYKTYRKENYTDYEFLKNTDKTIQKKSLMAVPDRLKIALIESGWILRNEIIWKKPNAMPESVKDRFTNNYEKIFFLTKEPRYYFKTQTEARKTVDYNRPRGSRGALTANSGLRERKETEFKNGKRNKRAVWAINTQPTKHKHFASFPEQLVTELLNAGCPPGGTILDPFAGSGTTLLVAKDLGLKSIGIEINPEYVDLIKERL